MSKVPRWRLEPIFYITAMSSCDINTQLTPSESYLPGLPPGSTFYRSFRRRQGWMPILPTELPIESCTNVTVGDLKACQGLQLEELEVLEVGLGLLIVIFCTYPSSSSVNLPRMHLQPEVGWNSQTRNSYRVWDS